MAETDPKFAFHKTSPCQGPTHEYRAIELSRETTHDVTISDTVMFCTKCGAVVLLNDCVKELREYAQKRRADASQVD